ncbi:MAG: tryptophan/tyrosine permease, partial [Coxiellaceae bacterium]|nr:tryptophan/tyrosine permease [Coxiellaceae bacterium]
MKSKIFGGVLLIVGTSLGAGMLALPLVTAAGGYGHSLWLFLATWLLTVFAAFLLLEVTLWLPEETNLISMARATLGLPGQLLTWFIYLLLLYSLLSAYISGGSDLLQGILASFHIKTPDWVDSIIFTAILGGIVYHDIKVVDWTNRLLMIVKMSAYVILVLLILPHVHLHHLAGGQFMLLSSAVMVVVTAFGYSVIIPSLRRYFNSNVSALRLTIALGSFGALLCYLLWDFVVQGSVSSGGG